MILHTFANLAPASRLDELLSPGLKGSEIGRRAARAVVSVEHELSRWGINTPSALSGRMQPKRTMGNGTREISK